MRPREVLAISLAPLASGILQGAVMGNAAALLFGAIAGYAFGAVIGLPTLVFIWHCGWRSVAMYLAAGTVAGAVAGLSLGLLLGFGNYGWGAVAASLVLFALHGLAVSLAYWLIAYAGVPYSSEGAENDAHETSNNEA